MNISVRGVSPEVFRQFKAEVVRNGENVGNAVTNALKCWLTVKKVRKKTGSFLKLKPFDWGKGSEKSSLDADEILYGKR